MPGAGLEPARGFPQRILSPLRLPDFATRAGAQQIYRFSHESSPASLRAMRACSR
jgi:hypothetical protein